MGFRSFCHPRVSLLFHRFLSPKGLSLSLEDCHQVSPLGLEDFSSSRVVPLILQVFVTQLSPFGFRNFLSPMVHPWVVQICHQSVPLLFHSFLSPKRPPFVSQFFVTQRSPLGFEKFLSLRVPPWVLLVSSPKCPPLGLQGFFFTKDPFLDFQVFRHPRVPPLGLEDFLSLKFPLEFRRLTSLKGPTFGLKDFSSSSVPPILGFTGFCHLRVPLWVWKIFCHKRSPLGFEHFFVLNISWVFQVLSHVFICIHT